MDIVIFGALAAALVSGGIGSVDPHTISSCMLAHTKRVTSCQVMTDGEGGVCISELEE